MSANRPNFFLIGAHKSATTSLFELLGRHPDVGLSSVKEPGYFSIPAHAARGERWYESLFKEARDRLAIGEASTTYSLSGIYPGTPERILKYSPDARFIYIVRNPWERLQSGWIQWRSEGEAIPKSFDAALRDYPALLDSGRYWTQLNRYRECVSDDRILVVFFEDFRRDAAGVVANCWRFLGLDVTRSEKRDSACHLNESSSKREDSGLLTTVKRLPGYRLLRDILMPAAIRNRVKRLVTVPMESRPEWNTESLEFVNHALTDQIGRFLEYCGQPSDYWAPPAAIRSATRRAA